MLTLKTSLPTFVKDNQELEQDVYTAKCKHFPWHSLNKKNQAKAFLDQVKLTTGGKGPLNAHRPPTGYTLDFSPLSSFTNVYCLCNAVIIFTQGRGRSEVETQPSWESTDSDGGLEIDSNRERTTE